MFDEIREALQALLHGNASPAERRPVLAQMRETLVQARMGLEDLKRGAETTRGRLTAERRELETIQRRKRLAEDIKDAETVKIAERYEQMHAERVALLERKLEAEEAELALTEREIAAMGEEYKLAMSGVPIGKAGARPTEEAPVASAEDELLGEVDTLSRARRRADADALAEEQLAALKRRMGK